MSNCTICIHLVFYMSRGTICISKTFTCRMFHRHYCRYSVKTYSKSTITCQLFQFSICKMTITCHVALSVNKIITYVKLSYLYIYEYHLCV